LTSACKKIQTTVTIPEAQQLANVLLDELNKQYANIEMNLTLARVTFLDPRFKRIGFSSENAFAKPKEKVSLIFDVLIDTLLTN
jgi:hypothetical protein